MRVEEGIAPYAVQANLLVPLGEVCKTTSGGTPSRKNPDYFSGPIPWVKSGELPDGPVVEIEESISEEALRQSSAKLFPAGTLLMALYGATVGKLGILTRPAATNQAVCAIFLPPDLDTKFLFWFLRFKRSELIAQAVGGAQPNISQGIVRDLKIPLLPLDQQKRIVAEIEKQFFRVNIEGVIEGGSVKGTIRREELGRATSALTIFGNADVGSSVLLVISESMRQIDVCEPGKPDSRKFYQLSRID